jgi:hypothetical protein
LVAVTKEIACPHCAAPLQVQPGEILVTCRYCGFTSFIETGKAFEFEHSLILNSIEGPQVFNVVQSWMAGSFLAPKDMQKKSTLTEQNLTYLPIWVVSAEAQTRFKGIIERMGPSEPQEGEISDRYDWLVLGRRQTDFPIRSYHLSLTGKIPFDAARIESGAKVLNSEIDADQAARQAQDEIENLHEYLAKEKIDRVEDIKTTFNVTSNRYLHAPVWFVTYTYKNSRYQVLLDGSSSEVIKGDMPSSDFKAI